MKTELFLAARYLRPRRSAVSLITVSSILGVTLGVAVLITVLAVMTGFTDVMKAKLLETQAHFQILSGGNSCIMMPDEAVKAVERCGGKAVKAIQSPVLVQCGRAIDTQAAVIGAEAEPLAERLLRPGTIKSGRLSLEHGEAVISAEMARRWRTGVGGKILLHTRNRISRLVDFRPDGGISIHDDAEAYLPMEFTVTGIYSVGKYDFDSTVFFIGPDDAAELFDLPFGSASVIFGWGPDPFRQEALVEALRGQLPYLHVVTWQENNRQLLSVLAVEKNMMFFLLIFIVLVAAFSITNTLITSVYQKTAEIGVLKALGAGNGSITGIFVLQGFLIGAAGSALGTGLGTLVIVFRMKIMAAVSRTLGIELFPKQLYYFDELPAHITAQDAGIIVTASVLLCTLGALLPALRAAKLDPAKALRHE